MRKMMTFVSLEALQACCYKEAELFGPLKFKAVQAAT